MSSKRKRDTTAIVTASAILVNPGYAWGYDTRRDRMAVGAPPDRRKRPAGCACEAGRPATRACLERWLADFRAALEADCRAGLVRDPAGELATFDRLIVTHRHNARHRDSLLRVVAAYYLDNPERPQQPATLEELRRHWHEAWHDAEPRPRLPRWAWRWNHELEPAEQPAPEHLTAFERRRATDRRLLGAARRLLGLPDDDDARDALRDAATMANELRGYPGPTDEEVSAALDAASDIYNPARIGRGAATQLAAAVSRVPVDTLHDLARSPEQLERRRASRRKGTGGT